MQAGYVRPLTFAGAKIGAVKTGGRMTNSG